MEISLIADKKSSILEILLAICIRETVFYQPQSSLWINRLFVNLTKKNEKICHIIDCRGTNPHGLDRFTTQADNAQEQTCYFNIENNDKLSNTFEYTY